MRGAALRSALSLRYFAHFRNLRIVSVENDGDLQSETSAPRTESLTASQHDSEREQER